MAQVKVPSCLMCRQVASSGLTVGWAHVLSLLCITLSSLQPVWLIVVNVKLRANTLKLVLRHHLVFVDYQNDTKTKGKDSPSPLCIQAAYNSRFTLQKKMVLYLYLCMCNHTQCKELKHKGFKHKIKPLELCSICCTTTGNSIYGVPA